MGRMRRMPAQLFHLAIPCRDLAEAERFYVEVLGGRAARRYADRVTLELFGAQVVCHLAPEAVVETPTIYPRHFGVTLRDAADFDALQREHRVARGPVLPRRVRPIRRAAGTTPYLLRPRPLQQRRRGEALRRPRVALLRAALRVLVATSQSADDRKTRVAVRSLAAAGMSVTLACDDPRCPVAEAPGVHAFRAVPDPLGREEAWARTVVAWGAQQPGGVLLALDDATTRAAARQRARLASHVAFALPDADVLDRAQDKRALLDIAAGAGVGTPVTRLVASADALVTAVAAVGWPCVLKPRRGAAGVGVRTCRRADELHAAWAGRPAPRPPLLQSDEMLLQAFVPGQIHDVGVLAAHGQVRAAVTQRRIRMAPPEGGPGVVVETTEAPEALRLAQRLVHALAWHGPAQIELCRDARDGSFVLLEVNGRFWGTLELSVRAGLDLPTMAVELALRGDHVQVRLPPAGIRAELPLDAGAPRDPSGSPS